MGTGRRDRDTDEKGDGQFLIVGRVDEVSEMGIFYLFFCSCLCGCGIWCMCCKSHSCEHPMSYK